MKDTTPTKWTRDLPDFKQRWVDRNPEPAGDRVAGLFAGISSEALTYVAALIARDLAGIPDGDTVKGYPLYDQVARIARALKELAR